MLQKCTPGAALTCGIATPGVEEEGSRHGTDAKVISPVPYEHYDYGGSLLPASPDIVEEEV
jgi:hypothetical protein